MKYRNKQTGEIVEAGESFVVGDTLFRFLYLKFADTGIPVSGHRPIRDEDFHAHGLCCDDEELDALVIEDINTLIAQQTQALQQRVDALQIKLDDAQAQMAMLTCGIKEATLKRHYLKYKAQMLPLLLLMNLKP